MFVAVEMSIKVHAFLAEGNNFLRDRNAGAEAGAGLRGSGGGGGVGARGTGGEGAQKAPISTFSPVIILLTASTTWSDCTMVLASSS